MNVTKISRGYLEIGDGTRCFRVYGEGLLPAIGGVEYVVYTNSVVECGVQGGGGPFKDELQLQPVEKAAVVDFLKRWVIQQGRRWDFE